MFLLILTLFSAVIVAIDQLTKFLVVENIPLFADVPLLPGIVQLTYAQNTGAAFSILKGQQWLFAVIFVLFTAVIVWAYFKKAVPFSKFEWFCIASVYGGGLGNMIDRLRLGYVIDMIETQFINFPIFNVADCFITCGCFALMISLLFINRASWKEGKK